MRARRGVTLVEIAIVVAIIGILAAIGAGMLSELIPSWRTRRAALDFAAAVEQARSMAIADNVQYRVHITDTDADPTSGSDNVGTYWVQKGDDAQSTTAWDTLPVDMSGTDTLTGEGYVNLARDQEDSLPWVSLKTPDSALAGVGTWTDSIVLNPRGQLDNPAADFACDANGDGSADGYICVTFVNKKRAVASGVEDKWVVLISRAGMARVQHGDESVGFTAGSAITSTPGASSSGYAGGSGSSSGSDTGSYSSI